MSARQPRFDVVHSDAGWFARFRAANGRKVWQTEVYTKRTRALDAIELIGGFPVSRYYDRFEVSVNFGVAPDTGLLEVREVDERAAVTP